MIVGKSKPIFDYLNGLRSSKFFKVFVWDILSKGADFALLPIYLKILSQEEYGFYTYTLYIITTISGIIKLGLDTSGSKMYYEQEIYDRGQMLFSTNIIWVLLFGILLFICVLTGIDIKFFTDLMNISVSDYNQIKWFFFAFILFNLVQTTLNVFFVIDNNAIIYQKYNLIRTLGGNLVVIGLLMFVVKGNKAYLRIYLEPILFFLSFIPLIIVFIKRMTFKIDWNAIKHAFSIGLPMVGTLIVAIVYNISDKYYLQKTSGFETLAVYNLAIFLTLPVSLIFGSFQTVWFPKFSQEKSHIIRFRKSNYFSIMLLLSFILLLITILVVIYIFIYFGIIDKTYEKIFVIFPIVFVARIAENITQIYNNFIVVWGKTIFNLIISIVFAIIAFWMNYMFIPKGGILIASGILFFIASSRCIVYFIYVKKNIRINHSNSLF